MPRLYVLAAAGVLLSSVLIAAVAWLLRQRWHGANNGRRTAVLAVGAACALLLWLLVSGIAFLWHERRGQPVTAEDLRILERADALLADEASWNRTDDKHCDDDDRDRRWSLFCAIEAACHDIVGSCEHTRVASQEVRFAIEEVAPGRNFEGRLMGFNNLPETRFEDIKRVLRIARKRVEARLIGSE